MIWRSFSRVRRLRSASKSQRRPWRSPGGGNRDLESSEEHPMIDVDELERLAKIAESDQTIGVHRDELLFLINRYRELPDLSSEELSEIGDIPGIDPEPGLSDSARQTRKCQAALREAKRRLAESRNAIAFFVECPDCHARVGHPCSGSGHEARLTTAFAELHRLGGSMYGEEV
jgi:hypothetical protein